MARSITQYDLLISCPGDAADSVEIIKEIIDEFNQQFSDVLGISIRGRYWKTSVYAESGGKPQDLINKQIVDNSDLAVAIFKNRFGYPTDKYGSGTEEEIEKMLSEGRQVFLFFDESPVIMSNLDRNEYDKVQEFKERYKDRGIFWIYRNEDDFRKIFRAQITRYFITLINSNMAEGQSKICIKSYKNGIFEETAQLSEFDMGGFESSEALMLQIHDIIQQINDMPLVMSCLPVQPELIKFMGKRVEIKSTTIDLVKKVAKKMGINLADSFFDMGNLTETLSFGGYDFNGTGEEKAKYKAILLLESIIRITLSHKQIEQYYKNLNGILFVLCNDGTRFDEDIDVEILMPKDRYIGIEELPVPSEDDNLGDDWCFEDIFEIPATKDFICYNDTKKTLVGINTKQFNPVNPFLARNIELEYRDTLRNIFDYQVYPDGNDLIIKIHFDYIKQHQCAAFPTWIFVKNPGDGLSIKYRITTKNNAHAIESQIDIRARSN